eukprot:690895_1
MAASEKDCSKLKEDDAEYVQLMRQLHDLLETNRALNKTLYENRSHVKSIVVLSSLMMVCVITMYVYYSLTKAMVHTASNPVLYPAAATVSQQREIAKVVAENDELKTVFYQEIAGRVEQINFDASIIKSDFVVHQKIAGKTGHYLKNIMVKLPMVGAAYSIAEMGAGIAKDMLVLNKMSDETLIFGCFSQKQLFQALATRLLTYDYVLKQIADVKTSVAELKNLKPEAAEKRMEKEVSHIAQKYGDYLTRIIGSGYGGKLWKACLEHEEEAKKWDGIDMLALLTINHPKGRSKLRFRKNQWVKEENQRRLDAIKRAQKQWSVPQHVMKVVFEYWTKFGTKEFALQIAGEAGIDPNAPPQPAGHTDVKPFYFEKDLETKEEGQHPTKDTQEIGMGHETIPTKRRFGMFHYRRADQHKSTPANRRFQMSQHKQRSSRHIT